MSLPARTFASDTWTGVIKDRNNHKGLDLDGGYDLMGLANCGIHERCCGSDSCSFSVVTILLSSLRSSALLFCVCSIVCAP